MSKQLKYKLKKTLKNAEFVHADLEYHEQLSKDALEDFHEEVARLIALLPEEGRQHLQKLAAAKQKTPPPPTPAPDGELDKLEETPTSDSTDLVPTDTEPETSDPKAPPVDKSMQLKKLFRRIAEQTHPDKVRASGFSDKEIFRMERIFIKAKQAYDDENWYILYSIAIELGLAIDDPTDEQIEWIEEDIKKTLHKIAQIANLTAWHWYTGTEVEKKMALQFYFHQAYGILYPDL